MAPPVQPPSVSHRPGRPPSHRSRQQRPWEIHLAGLTGRGDEGCSIAQGNRQEETEYHAVICFGRLAEVCALYCTRGRRVYVEGKLRTRDYTGGDGLRRFSTEVVAESVKLLSARRTSEDLATEESDENASAELPVAS